MRFFLISVFLLTLRPMAQSQELSAYRLYRADGTEVAFGAVVGEAADANVVFFGELHNNPIAHWLQLELSRALYKRKGEHLVLGAEMFESDNQLILNEYLADLIAEKSFEEEARLWNNYATDYKPLVQLAKEEGLPFIATNVPRRYANLVYRKGIEQLDSLPHGARAYLPPLPIPIDLELPGYKKMAGMMSGHGGEAMAEQLVQAQAIKDATMAHFIAANYRPEDLFLHFNGAYHSENKEGIVWYLNRYRPGLNIVTLSTVEQDVIDSLEKAHQGKADFLLVVPASMTKTY